MGDEGDIGGDKERKDSAEVPTSSSGQRLDQFLNGAQRLGDIAREKARGVANAAAPKFKELQKNASANASRLLDSRSGSSSILFKIRTYLGSGSRLRKGLILYGGLLIMLLLLSKLMTSNRRDEPGPDRANLEKIKSDMTEEQVDKLLGTPTAADKRPDGSLAKTWTPTATNDGPIHVTFVDGKVATKVMDEAAASAPDVSPSVEAPAQKAELQDQQGRFYARHSGQWTIRISLPSGDVSFRFDMSADGAKNAEFERGDVWSEPTSDIPVQVDGILVKEDDYAILTMTLPGGKFTLGVKFNGNEIRGAVTDGDQMFPIHGVVK